MPPEDLPAVARRLADAVLRHAQAVADDDPDPRMTAGRALTAALSAYGIAGVNAGSEPVDGAEDFDAWLDDEDGVHHEEDPPDHRERFGILFVPTLRSQTGRCFGLKRPRLSNSALVTRQLR